MPLGLEKFWEIPNTKKWIIKQNDPQTYRIVNKDDQLETYFVTSLTATTNSHYFLKRKDTTVGEVEQDRIQNRYDLIIDKKTVGSIKFDKNLVELDYDTKLSAQPKLRGKEFAFIDENKDIVLTIDKKTLSISKDKYSLVHHNDFNEIIATLIVIAIDDSYHGGLLS